MEKNDREILETFLKTKLKEKPKFEISEFLFKEQLALVLDSSKFATAVCSVRAGKTIACAADLIHTALSRERTTGLYITLARSSAKRIIWPELHHINTTYDLGGIANESELSFRFPNGSLIYCSGASDATEIEKFRGLSNVALAYLDESQAFRSHIKELVEEILIKRLYDTDGRLRLIGTPGPIPAGYFYDASQSSKWSHHGWTLHSNPWIERKSGKTAAQLIEQDCERKGVGLEDPSIQRECFGKWVLDSKSLLLEYHAEKSHFEELPPGTYTYILGIDLGLKDADSLSLLAFSDTSPITYLVEEIVTANQLTDDLARQIMGLQKLYPISEMPTDAGGLGAKIVEDLKFRYGLPLTPADKKDKMANYRLLNNALQNGTFKAKRTSQFAQDCQILEKDFDRSTPEKILVKGHSDAVDSTLYAFKLSPAYGYSPPVPKPQLGSPEYVKDMEEKHEEAAIEKVQRSKKEEEGKLYGSWQKNKRGVPNWNEW